LKCFQASVFKLLFEFAIKVAAAMPRSENRLEGAALVRR
jgi:hypothetical protein